MMRAVPAPASPMKRLLGFSFACGLGFVSALAQAGAPSAARLDLPLWEVGVFGVGISQQAYPGADEQTRRALVLPYAVYRGDVLRADDEGAGLRAVRTERFELDVSFAVALGSGAHSTEARRGMRRLGTLVEAGPVARWFLNGRGARDRVSFDLPLRGVFDAGDHGHHRGMSFEPHLGMERHATPEHWGYRVSVSALFGDRRVGSTFYTVAPGEALPERPAFDARSGLIAWRLNGSVTRDLTPDLRVIAFGRIESVAGAANRASPLVRQTTGVTYGLGLTYTLMRSAVRSSD